MQDYSDTSGSPLSSREPASRKEREKRARELEILKAARELFVSKGFRETTLDEIARQAEFGKGTLYNYFASKEDLFLGIIEQTIEEILRIASGSVSGPGSARDKLSRYAREIIEYTRDNGELLHVVYHELRRGDSAVSDSKLRQLLAHARRGWEILAQPLAEGMEQGVLRTADPRQLIILFDGMLRGYCFHRFAIERSQADEDISAVAELITSVLFDGITERQDKG
jgi:AcrR family transcriptional regulator